MNETQCLYIVYKDGKDETFENPDYHNFTFPFLVIATVNSGPIYHINCDTISYFTSYIKQETN